MTFSTARLAATKAPFTALCTTTPKTTTCLAALSRSLGPRTHQRRPSSSKSSSPANGSKRVAQAQDLPANTNTSANNGKVKDGEGKPSARKASSQQKSALGRKAKEAVNSLTAVSDALQGKAVDATGKAERNASEASVVDDLPRVQSNGSSLQDIHLSSFFAMHRPIAPTAAFPVSVTDEQFASLLQPAPAASETAQAVSELTAHFQRLKFAKREPYMMTSPFGKGDVEADSFRALLIGKPFQTSTPADVQHLDGEPGTADHQQSGTSRYRQLRQSESATSSQFPHEPSPVTQVRLYTADVKLTEYVHENGAVTSAYDTSPVVEQPRPFTHPPVSDSAILSFRPSPWNNHDSAVSPFSSTTPPSSVSHQPHWSVHRRAMWQRQDASAIRAAESGWIRVVPMTSPATTSRNSRLVYETLSVKRIRREKMKKKKYKKLLKRTRNLRTKIDKGS